jgi:hypothetical protein
MRLSTVQILAGCLLGAVFLCSPAYYNLLPLWFRDTPAYLEAGFDNVLTHRVAWPYGAFVRHGSLSESLWLVLLLQGCLLTGVLYFAFKLVFKTQRAWHFLLYTIFAGMTTAASFHSSHLAPDVFTPMLLLLLGMLLFVPNLNRREQVILSLLFVVSISMSQTHWALVVVSLLLLALSCLSTNLLAYYKKTALSWKRLGWVLGLSLGTYLMVSSVHWGMGGNFKPSQGGSFYLFARLWDFDVAQDYLQETYCSSKEHPLCNQIDALVRGKDYLHGKELPNLQNQGGWTAENEQLFAQINREILTTPTYLKRYCIKSLEQTFAQLVLVEMQPNRFEEREALLASIVRFYPNYQSNAKYGRQHLGLYRNETVYAKSQLQILVLGLSLLLLLWWALNGTTQPRYRERLLPLPTVVTGFLVLGILANAIIAAGYWGYEARYQSRIAWLLTLPACWLFFRGWDAWHLKQSTDFSTDQKQAL